jgi:putative hydrolase of HD superfamily
VTSPLPAVAEFLMELDGLKLVERRTYISGGQRRENSGEHSWHVALAAWALASHLGRDISLEKLLKLALIHDLGEIGAGDTFLYAADRHQGASAEREHVTGIALRHGALIPDLEALWDEQELGQTPEARLLKIADRVLPFLHNITSEGRAWRENGIARSQVLGAHSFIAGEAPELFAWIEAQVEEAVRRGWLRDG